LNAMEPIIAFNLFRSIDMLGRSCRVLAGKCVDGITANRERCRRMVENSISIVTALNPIIGYEQSSALAREALETDRSIYDLAIEKGVLSRETLDEILTPENMTHPRYLKKR